MRWTAAAIGMTVAALVVAAGWMAWVISQGTNQVIDITVGSPPQLMEHEWWAFRYAAGLLAAFIIAVAVFVTVNVRPPVNQTLRLALGGVAGLEILVFGFVWFALVVFPLSSP